jgi:hypothetical protein
MKAHVIADGFVVNALCLCWVSFLYPTYKAAPDKASVARFYAIITTIYE